MIRPCGIDRSGEIWVYQPRLLDEVCGQDIALLHEQFHESTGVSQRFALLESWLHRRAGGEPSSDCAARFGYYEQSHLIADFHDFTKLTPNEYLRKKSAVLNFIPIES